jgi:hypothetical protein
MSDGFLGRWSRRKQDVRKGKAVVEPAPLAPAPAGETTSTAPAVTTPAGNTTHVGQVVGQRETAPLPTLHDVPALTPASDFKPFMAQGVAQDVRNAAVKKLFADPHFNVMDRLDTYIDDYGQADPIPPAMLRRMASASTLNLFDDADDGDDGAANPPTAGDDVDIPPVPDVAQSDPASESPAVSANAPGPLAALTSTEDAHTDLRLQPDDAPQRNSAGPGT